MKNNKGYYSWIHSLNEAAVQSQIFQQQLDEEKAKKKAGGMPGFFSSGPATPAKRKEETGEPTVPAHMPTTSRLGDTVQSEPKIEPVSKPETTAKKLPARPVELPKSTRKSAGERNKRKKIPQTDEAPAGPLTQDELKLVWQTDPAEFGLPPMGSEGSGGEAEPVSPSSLSRALARPNQKDLSVDVQKAGRKADPDPELSPEEISASVKYWQQLRFGKSPSNVKASAKLNDAKFYKEHPHMAPSSTDLGPSDFDDDGDVDTDDVIANITVRDQYVWGERIEDPETGETRYVDSSAFSKASSPEAWEGAYRDELKRISAEKLENKKKLDARVAELEAQRSTSFDPTPKFTRQAGELQGAGTVKRQRMGTDKNLSDEEKSKAEKLERLFQETQASRAAARAEREARPSREEEIAANAARGNQESIFTRLKNPSTRVRVRGEGEQETLVPGREFLEKELESRKRLPQDAKRPSENPTEDSAGTGSISRGGTREMSPQEIRDMNAEERRQGIKRAQRALDAERKKARQEAGMATVQESIANIVNKMLLG